MNSIHNIKYLYVITDFRFIIIRETHWGISKGPYQGKVESEVLVLHISCKLIPQHSNPADELLYNPYHIPSDILVLSLASPSSVVDNDRRPNTLVECVLPSSLLPW